MLMQTDFAPPMTPPPPGLTRKRKAAMIVQLLISDGNTLALSELPEHLQEALAEEMGAIRLVDRDTVNAVANEFVEILESIGLSAPGGMAAAVAALSNHISPGLARRLQAQIDGQMGLDPWGRLLALEDEEFKTILLNESIPVGAVLLSKLPVTRAAKVLGMIPGEMARRITFAVSQTENVGPEAVFRIGQGLVADYCKTRETAFEKTPVVRVGDILNSSPSMVRDDVLDGLEAEDETFAKSVRKKIFTFANIPDRLRPIDVPGLLRVIEPESLHKAMAAGFSLGGDENDAAEYILSCISQRMANQIKEEANGIGTQKPAEAEEAMNIVAAAIRDLADAGTITLIEPEEDEEEGS